MMVAVTGIPTEKIKNSTIIERIGPVNWPSTTDPYHKHSGHVLKDEGSTSWVAIDLLNTPRVNSVGILRNPVWLKKLCI